MRVAVMQPYFFPYAGYFRLAAASDLFVVLDNVQFPRRGWVHRNRLHLADGELDWLTLPLAKAPQSVLIQDLMFQPIHAAAMDEWRDRQPRRFPALAKLGRAHPALVRLALQPEGTVADYIERGLRHVLGLLGIERPMIRASSLTIPDGLRAQDLIIAVATSIGARSYVNAPGGRGMYDAAAFARAGLSLGFLPQYQGSYASILDRLADSAPEAIAAELLAQCQLEIQSA